MSFDFAEIYRSTRLGLLTLAADLSDAEWMTLAPATPEWTVKDLYGHLTGVAADLLAGNLEIVGSDEWTARQVAARADHSPQEVCAEWTAVGPEVEDRLVAIGSPLSSMVIDVWHHEQDVRNAVDRTANRSGEGLRLSLRAGNAIGPKMEQAGLAALHLHTDGYDREFGVGEAEVTVSGNPYEMARAFMGRRSFHQIRQFDWTGDAEPYLPIFSIFPPRSDDLDE
ncbi:MAG: maleylpyruvate isomerase family mycothiol-dependent enzyme [Acidobacteria bacterium]|nr:maleylpyruvate isomerase family mycothiol-dependent enzyme [Acidobacteriota bacterium]